MTVRRLRIPYTVGLVIAGTALALLPFVSEISLTKELVFDIFLPPLIFEAALYIRWDELKRDLPVILVLVTLGVLLSASVTALGMYYFARWEWSSAILFGALIAATDPVSVVATFKEAGVHGRLKLLVEAESLLNDGTAAIVFSLALVYATGEPIGPGGVVQSLLLIIAGGILCGSLVAIGILALAGRTHDHLVELTLTTIAAYGSFLIAEQFHFSGVLAAMTAGLLIGNVGSLGPISEKGQESVEAFWEFAAFVANSLIFVLIGITIARQQFSNVFAAILVAIIAVILGRAIAIYPCSLLFSRSTRRIDSSHQHILFWGGLRGALALALALSLTAQIARRDEIITVAFAVVAFSVLVQGLTITPLIRRLIRIP